MSHIYSGTSGTMSFNVRDPSSVPGLQLRDTNGSLPDTLQLTAVSNGSSSIHNAMKYYNIELQLQRGYSLELWVNLIQLAREQRQPRFAGEASRSHGRRAKNLLCLSPEFVANSVDIYTQQNLLVQIILYERYTLAINNSLFHSNYLNNQYLFTIFIDM